MNDPWEKMTIEKQYLSFLKERPEPGLPATLAYLEEHRYDGYSQTVGEIMNDVIMDLHAHLAAGSYAEALVEKVWDGEETLAEVMAEQLDDAEELLQRVIASNPLRW